MIKKPVGEGEEVFRGAGPPHWVRHKYLVPQTFSLWLLLSQYYQFPGIHEKCSLGHFNSENVGCRLCVKWLELHQTTVIKNAPEGFSLAGSQYFWGRIGGKRETFFQPLLWLLTNFPSTIQILTSAHYMKPNEGRKHLIWTILCRSPERSYTKELKKQGNQILVVIKRSPETQAW